MRFAIALVLLSPGVWGGLTYNNDMECGYPFSEFSIQDIECTPNYYYNVGDYTNGQAEEYQYYQQQQQQQQEEQEDEDRDEEEEQQQEEYYNQFQPGSCLPGEIMDISGSITIINEPVTKYFDVTLRMCWTKWNFDFKCITHTELIDLGYLAAEEQYNQQKEEEEQQDEEQNQNNQNGQQQAYFWYNPQKYYSNNENMYLQPGTYSYSVRLTIPDNQWTQADTPGKLYLTFKPKQKYNHPYYQERPWYSRVKDYRFKTKCYATFNQPYGSDEDGEDGYYNNQYYEAAFGAALLSMFVAYRRRQLALRGDGPLLDIHEKHDDA